MKYDIEQAIDVLSRTPRVLSAMLHGMNGTPSEPWAMNNYGQDTFSPFDVVGHLIHGEQTDWIPRARIILDYGEERPFETFDRYAMYEASRGKHMDELLKTFAELRAENIENLRAMRITEDQFSLTGIHPELGRVTLGNLLSTWVCHDLHHTHQIAKSMVYQYKGNVGPWHDYISLMPK